MPMFQLVSGYNGRFGTFTAFIENVDLPSIPPPASLIHLHGRTFVVSSDPAEWMVELQYGCIWVEDLHDVDFEGWPSLTMIGNWFRSYGWEIVDEETPGWKNALVQSG